MNSEPANPKSGRHRPFRSPPNFGGHLAVCVVLIAPLLVFTFSPADASMGATERVSLAADGSEANRASTRSTVSENGRHVAFESRATNLVSGATGESNQIFVKDLATGQVVAASLSSTGVWGNNSSSYPSISGNGRYVAFVSRATNLTSDDPTNREDIFLRDLLLGTTQLISRSTSATSGNGYSWDPSVSRDGSRVAFSSTSSNLVSGDGNNYSDVFVRDVPQESTSRISRSSTAEGNAASERPRVSADGAFVAFESKASNLVFADVNVASDVFVANLASGTLVLASVDSNEVQGGSGSYTADISGDGRYVVFQSASSNLDVTDLNEFVDVFRRDLVSGTTQKVSVNTAGLGGDSSSYSPSISTDGNCVMFASWATNLAGDVNYTQDIFVRDVQRRATSVESVNSSGAQDPLWDAIPGDISADGRFVTFQAGSALFDPQDSNNSHDIFRRDRGERVAPVISSLTASPSAFSPNADGISDTTAIRWVASDESPMLQWTLSVVDSSGLQVISWSGAASSGETVERVWDGRNNLGQSILDGYYSVRLSVADRWGNTSSRTGSVVVDRGPPTVAPQAPLPDHNTLLRRPEIRASASDALSGVSTYAISLDGTVVTTEGNSYTPPSDLALGVHNLTVTAFDLAGNQASTSWRFSVVEMSTGPALATLQEQTSPLQLVDEDGSPLTPSTYKATFTDVPVEVSQYLVTMTSSDFATGKGRLYRDVALTDLRVTFVNALGQREAKTISLAPSRFETDLAVIAPSSEVLVAGIPARTNQLPRFSVEPPSTFVITNGSFAILEFAAKQVGAGISLAEHQWLDPLPYSISSGSVAGSLTCSVRSDLSAGCNGFWPSVYVVEPLNGRRIPVFGQYSEGLKEINNPQRSDTWGQNPNPNPSNSDHNACADSCINLKSSEPTDRWRTYWRVGDLFGAYGHHYAFGIKKATTETAIVWQASDADVGSYSAVSGTTSACLSWFSHSSEDVAGTHAIGTADFTHNDTSVLRYRPQIDSMDSRGYKIGSPIGEGANLEPMRSGESLNGTLSGQPNQVVRVDESGPITTEFQTVSGLGSFNAWDPDGAGSRADAGLLSVTEFTGSISTYSLNLSLQFAFAFTQGAC